jgi:hypothetical protein
MSLKNANVGGMNLPTPWDEPTLSPECTGELLGVGRSAAYESVRSGLWPTIQVSAKRRRIPTAWVWEQLGLTVPERPGRDVEATP